ncbi:MAG: hypothetical protein F6J95_031550 [Leptolyngbya sp. SIO1E4]|nr:hypothetical protein [Leptolyngbya sp. SIO1E4]
MMYTQNPTRRLIRTLGLGWLAFAGVGLLLHFVIRIPAITVIIDRSYCPPDQWQQQVVQPYRDLYQQAHSKQLQITQVVVMTDIDQTPLPTVPAPEALGNPFGQAPDFGTVAAVAQQFPDAVFLRCKVP